MFDFSRFFGFVVFLKHLAHLISKFTDVHRLAKQKKKNNVLLISMQTAHCGDMWCFLIEILGTFL